MQFNQNNLDKSSSPYLKQHKNNPIHWQEWSQEVLDFAKQNNKIIFLSIGYSTCHWCHVMAQHAFSDKLVADFLNENFISIKVDKEQRPDIDKKMMEVIINQTGNGGWPLNIFLTSDLTPFYPLTYSPAKDFLELLMYIKNYNVAKGVKPELIIPFDNPSNIHEDSIIKLLSENYDFTSGGFGEYQKFAHPTATLFMLHYYEENKNEKLKEMIIKLLDVMMKNGLHDHLQGGFYRYCVDVIWKIPHFEKMLYDQAMHLWVYSLAYKIFKDENYKSICNKIFECLKETYSKSNLFISAHDADTNHIEGDTYIWEYNELKNILTSEEFNLLKESYEISENGNFEGKIHLIKRKIESNTEINNNITSIEKKLLEIRNKKEQPFADEKIITSWNSILGIALINAYRYLGKKEYLETSEILFSELSNNNFNDNKLFHSSLNGNIQKNEFLEDYSSFLLFITYLHEETNKYKDHLISFNKKLEEFKENNQWIESNNKDFEKTIAGYYDHPIPSSTSLAELASLRSNILLGNNYLKDQPFKESIKHDFLNISILIKKGLFHIITNKEKINWDKLPLNTIQIKSDKFTDCYKGACSEINNYNSALT